MVFASQGRVPHDDVNRYHSIIDIAPFPRTPDIVCEFISPLKPFESMAMGQVVVGSDVAALREIITDGEHGRLFKKGDSHHLSRFCHPWFRILKR
jgi:glycosyltransferase involved in cell wall biosynthesis